MTIKHSLLPAAALLAALLMPLAAQAQVPHPHPTTVRQRVQDQHARLKQGVASGQLTHREARNDRARLARIRSQESRARALHHGHLTASERRHQERELNRESRDLHRTKHNARVR